MRAPDREQRRLHVLLQVAERLNRTLEVEVMARTTLDLLFELIGVTVGWIVLEAGEGRFELIAARGVPAALAADGCAALRGDRCRCQRALQAGKLDRPVNIIACERLLRLGAAAEGLRYHASVPLHLPEGRRGLMNLACSGGCVFDEQELTLLRLIGESVSAGIHRAELYQRAKAGEADTKRRMISILEATTDLVAMADADGHLTYVNRCGRRLLGLGDGQAVGGITLAGLFRESGRTSGIEQMATDSVYSAEAYLQRHDGHQVPVSMVRIAHSDADAQLAFTSVIARDISGRKRLERELMRLANHDPLTGLLNRRRLDAVLRTELGAAARGGRSGALLFLDLDGFKSVNDSLGHDAGDEVLLSVARLLRATLGSEDTAARIGGDEFAVVLPGAGAEEAQARAARILGDLRQYSVPIYGQPVSVLGSIGVALYPQHGGSARELLSHADVAMYRAKRHHNHACMYAAEMQTDVRALARLDWDLRAREVLDRGRLQLFWQPILDLRQQRVSQYELLLRVRTPDGLQMPPQEFIEAAERTGVVGQVDRWVARRAIRLLARCRRAGAAFALEVNLSAKTLSDGDFLEACRRDLARSDIDPARLIFELTETAVIADIEQAEAFIRQVRRLGCRLALDDFGVGYAGFAHLKRLPVDYIKIDGSFIRNLTRDPVDQSLVRGMVQLARGLGVLTIAEFVERPDTLTLLGRYGVDYAQGYFIGPPRAVGRSGTAAPGPPPTPEPAAAAVAAEAAADAPRHMVPGSRRERPAGPRASI